MNRTVYVIRHGQSEGNRHNQSSSGPEGGALIEPGISEARALQPKLKSLGIDVLEEPVATSYMRRAYDTARYAGFKTIKKYECLNEVGASLPPGVLDAMLERREIPPAVISAARRLLSNPPPERIWVTHGQLIAGIANVLGYPPSRLFIPKMGTVTKIQLPQTPHT